MTIEICLTEKILRYFQTKFNIINILTKFIKYLNIKASLEVNVHDFYERFFIKLKIN